jgi:hypothetical protein
LNLGVPFGRAFRSYLFVRDLSKRITAAIPNAGAVDEEFLASNFFLKAFPQADFIPIPKISLSFRKS